MFCNKKKKLRMLVPAGQNSVVIELGFKPKEVGACFVQSRHNHEYPACNPSPQDQVSCEVVGFKEGNVWGIQVSWTCAGPREIEILASNRKL
jgi:hypothetical protein